MEKTNPNPSQDRVEELKPCPFCGASDAELRVSITDAMVACNNCGARTGLVYLGADEASNAYREREAIAAWNRRPESEAVTVMRKALEQIASGTVTKFRQEAVAREALARIGGAE